MQPRVRAGEEPTRSRVVLQGRRGDRAGWSRHDHARGARRIRPPRPCRSRLRQGGRGRRRLVSSNPTSTARPPPHMVASASAIATRASRPALRRLRPTRTWRRLRPSRPSDCPQPNARPPREARCTSPSRCWRAGDDAHAPPHVEASADRERRRERGPAVHNAAITAATSAPRSRSVGEDRGATSSTRRSTEPQAVREMNAADCAERPARRGVARPRTSPRGTA